MLDCVEVLLKAMFSGLKKAYTKSPTAISPEASVTASPALIRRSPLPAEPCLSAYSQTLQSGLSGYQQIFRNLVTVSIYINSSSIMIENLSAIMRASVLVGCYMRYSQFFIFVEI